MAFTDMPQPIDVSDNEIERSYHYSNGVKFTITAPSRVYVLPNGSHRVIDGGGIVYRPTPGWLAISWLPKSADRPFVA